MRSTAVRSAMRAAKSSPKAVGTSSKSASKLRVPAAGAKTESKGFFTLTDLKHLLVLSKFILRPSPPSDGGEGEIQEPDAAPALLNDTSSRRNPVFIKTRARRREAGE